MQILKCFRQKGKWIGEGETGEGETAHFPTPPVWSEVACALRALASKSCSSRCSSRQGSRVTGDGARDAGDGARDASSASAGSNDLEKDNASAQRQEQAAPEQQHAQQDFALSAKAEKVETKGAKAALLLPGAAAVSLSMASSMPSSMPAEGMPVPACAPGAETTAEKQRSSSGRGGQTATNTQGRAVDVNAMSHAKGTLPRGKPKTGCGIEAGAVPAASAGTRMQTRAHSNDMQHDNGSQAPADEISPSQMETAKKDSGGAATNARGEGSGQKSEAKRSLDLEAGPADASSTKRRRMTNK